MDTWQYPTSTCERYHAEPPYQPYSAAVNLAAVAMIVGKRRQTRLTRSILWFELVHAYAHAFGGGPSLALLQHVLIYPIIDSYTGRLGAWAVVDLAVALSLGGIWQFLSGVALFFHAIPAGRCKPEVARGAALVVVLLACEVLACEALLQRRDLPYHALLEVAGMYTFYHMIRPG